MATERADWHFTASACRLGRELYYERIEAFELDGEKTWEVQPVSVKDFYIAKAARLLREVAPQTRGSLLPFAQSIDLRTVIGETR